MRGPVRSLEPSCSSHRDCCWKCTMWPCHLISAGRSSIPCPHNHTGPIGPVNSLGRLNIHRACCWECTSYSQERSSTKVYKRPLPPRRHLQVVSYNPEKLLPPPHRPLQPRKVTAALLTFTDSHCLLLGVGYVAALHSPCPGQIQRD